MGEILLGGWKCLDLINLLGCFLNTVLDNTKGAFVPFLEGMLCGFEFVRDSSKEVSGKGFMICLINYGMVLRLWDPHCLEAELFWDWIVFLFSIEHERTVVRFYSGKVTNVVMWKLHCPLRVG